MDKDQTIQNDKLIKMAKVDYKLAMFNNQFEEAAKLKKYIKYLFDQKELP